jgi:hypothetical protein
MRRLLGAHIPAEDGGVKHHRNVSKRAQYNMISWPYCNNILCPGLGDF